MPHWVPQAQFAGFYMAKEKGFYASNGLDVTILDARPDGNPERELADGKVDFITRFLAVALEDRATKGIPLVNIAQIGQHSALMIITRKSSGINGIKDLEGKRLYTWPDTQISAMLKKASVQARIIQKGSSNALFLEGGADAMSAMWYNEYHALIAAGIDTNDMTVFFAEESGLNFPEDGIYCLASTLAGRPEACKAFVAASLQGWRYALDNREETLKTVMKRVRAAHTGSNAAHQRWMLERMGDLIDPGRIRMGELSKADYTTVVHELLEAGVITNAPSMEEFNVDLSRP